MRHAAILFGALCLASPGFTAGSGAEAAYQETVRCFTATAAYVEGFEALGKSDAQSGKLIDHGVALRKRALKQGAAIGKTEDDFMMERDETYLDRFYSKDKAGGTLRLSEFGQAEIKHCRLDAVIR